jgi:hypothetical protein
LEIRDKTIQNPNDGQREWFEFTNARDVDRCVANYGGRRMVRMIA